MSLGFRLNRFWRDFHETPVLRNQRWLTAFTLEAQQDLVNAQYRNPNLELSGLKNILECAGNTHWISAVQSAYINTYLQEDILTKIDRASMAHSLEVRSPFLDQRVAALSASIPPQWKMRRMQTKYILKRAFSRDLPKNIIHRSKKGFGIPKAKWLKEDLKPYLTSLFSKDRMKKTGLFSIPYVHRLMHEHLNNLKDHQKELWTLLMFELWRQENKVDV